MQKEQFIGTSLPSEEFRMFGVSAAQNGLSKRALMRQIALEYLSRNTRRTSSATESASSRTTPRRKAS